MAKNWKYFLWDEETSRTPTLATFIKQSFVFYWSSSHSNQRQKWNKRNQNWKRRNKILTVCLYTDNPENATRKFLELIHVFGKFEGYKINTHKSLTFLYTNNRKSEREIEKIPFTKTSKRIKYLGINLPKKDDAVKVLHSICQQIWKTQQWTQDWKRSVFTPIPKKGNAKEFANYRTIALISHANNAQNSPTQASVKHEPWTSWCSSWF